MPANLVVACASCNLSKGSLLPSEWLGDVPEFVARIESAVSAQIAKRISSRRDRRATRTKAQIIAQERYGKGTPEWIGRGGRGCWFARVSLPEGRKRYRLTAADGRPLDRKDEDRDEAVRLTAAVSERLRAQAATADMNGEERDAA